ncbi:MAG: histidinol-phosphatase [Proteobacteria bacterium]|nr:histidinol-phosphatase [Pseudomonadota bacterium]
MRFEYSDPVTVSAAQISEMLSFARKVAVQAGAATLQYFRTSLDVQNKLADGRFDPVTQADRAAENVIRQAVEQTYPEHGIYGEEFGYQAGNGLTWVIDPIDGTRAFMSGMVHWGVLLGLFDGQKPVLGVMVQPFTGEVFSGDSLHAWYESDAQQSVMQVRKCPHLDQAVLASCGPQYMKPGVEREAFARLESAAMMTRYGGDCYLYAMLAMGHLDVVVDANLNAYDVQALIPIIRGAGGVATTWSGDDPSMGGSFLASGNKVIHQQALKIISG